MVDYKYRSPWNPDAFIAELGVAPETVHHRGVCARDEHCAIHRPSDHHMRQWPAIWRNDTGLIERICEHGIGHPDPDSRLWLQAIGRGYVGTHGCDGCCRP